MYFKDIKKNVKYVGGDVKNTKWHTTIFASFYFTHDFV